VEILPDPSGGPFILKFSKEELLKAKNFNVSTYLKNADKDDETRTNTDLTCIAKMLDSIESVGGFEIVKREDLEYFILHLAKADKFPKDLP
jgi:hypothetical protein